MSKALQLKNKINIKQMNEVINIVNEDYRSGKINNDTKIRTINTLVLLKRGEFNTINIYVKTFNEEDFIYTKDLIEKHTNHLDVG